MQFQIDFQKWTIIKYEKNEALLQLQFADTMSKCLNIADTKNTKVFLT